MPTSGSQIRCRSPYNQCAAICSADDINAGDFPNSISDEIFSKIVAVIRIAVPYTGMIISTRESQESRKKVLELGTHKSAAAHVPV